MTTQTTLDVHRDDGPLASVLHKVRLPFPEVIVLGSAALLSATGAVVVLVGTAPPVPRWWLAAGVWALALTGVAGRALPRLDWPRPALLRGTEYAAVLMLVGDDPWTYALLATLAFHHYDIVYRVALRGAGPPVWLRRVSGGWSLRLPLLIVATAVGVEQHAAAALTLVLAPMLLAESVFCWTRASRDRR